MTGGGAGGSAAGIRPLSLVPCGRGSPPLARRGARRPGQPPGRARALRRARARAHDHRARAGRSARHRPRGDRPHRRGDRRAGAPGARHGVAGGDARQPAQRSQGLLQHPGGGSGRRRAITAGRGGDDPGLVRPASGDSVRGGRHAPARGGALDHRLLPRAGRGWRAAGALLHQHLRAPDPPALRGRSARLPRVGARPPPAGRHRPGAHVAADLPPPR